MKIKIAECSGFCFGVKRAISMAKQALEKNKGRPVYSLGHIIHNSQVVEELSREGLKAIKDLDGIKEGVIVVSSHGASPALFEQLKSRGLEVIDATCPFVMSAQKIVKALNEEGYTIIILGDKEHPEVKSLLGFAKDKAIVVKDEKKIKGIEMSSKKIGLISQTTQSSENYNKVISEIMKKGFLEFRVFNTICNDTKKRQDSAARLAKNADTMIIVGGRMSANTKRLFQICSGICKDTYHIETEVELKTDWFTSRELVGIASGASTPDWIIEKAKSKITEISNS
ncbi:MAG: 4-hydroxy-3-methylbut-2-enyl diphosphate reductase [Candidatus Omnitrophica bacterium]|nr:4-hydroxy-3-methylbut-2-enyl diphosphate reductase [Candidatus Omnitrophota bacterium]